MAIFIDPLFGREEPVGVAFVCYSRKDKQDVKNIIETIFSYEKIPFFIDEKDIHIGELTIKTIKNNNNFIYFWQY